MTKTKLTQFKNRLLTERDTLIDCLTHQNEEADQYPDEVIEPLTESESNLLKKIELALLKIENKTYGICAGCGGEIPIDRLEAKPSVSLCCDCQKKHETAA